MPDGVDVTKMLFMTGVDTTVAGIEGCRVTRCGYTGEDGYEVSSGCVVVVVSGEMHVQMCVGTPSLP